VIKGILFDFGGVLMRTEDQSFRLAWENRFGLAPGELLRIVSDNEASRMATLGLGTESQIWATIQRRFELSSGELDDLRRDFWAGDRLDTTLLAYLASLRPRYKTALLSNAWTGARTIFTENYHLDQSFDLLVISSEEGIAKPDPMIYRITASHLGILPEEAVFVDDMEKNVTAAISVGMHGILFQSTNQVLLDLRQIVGFEAKVPPLS